MSERGARKTTRELWKPIPGHARYEASNLGRIRRLLPKRSAIRILKPHHATTHDQAHVEGRFLSIARLVLLAWRGEPGEGQRAYHRDGDCRNNRVTNLEWADAADISARIAARGDGSPWARFTNAEVARMRDYVRRHGRGAQTHLADKLGISPQRVNNLVRGRYYPTAGRPCARLNTVLSPTDAKRIRDLYASGDWTLARLGARFKVSGGAIWLIVTGRSHRHAGGPIRARRRKRSRS